MNKSKILGGGFLSGLSSAITLAKGEREIIVYEKRSDGGKHTKPNYQRMLNTKRDIKKYLTSLDFNNIIDFSKTRPKGVCFDILESFFYNAEIYKGKILGR
ncbi:MAG: hypothetical protein CVU81_01475 [Euryarchaeota archaeon HGW-Euryarchaeota-1]|nr:MAG: hypothetical protein CVU81_01475 [Euryarchaeota archaeon HGW-Euryarchaeota-1]